MTPRTYMERLRKHMRCKCDVLYVGSKCSSCMDYDAALTDHARLTRIADAARTLLEGSDDPARDPDGEYRKVRLCDWDALNALINTNPTERPTEREMK